MVSSGKSVKKKATRKKPASKTAAATAKKTTKKVSSKKKTVAKKVASKKTAAKQPARSTNKTKTSERTNSSNNALQKIDPEHRRRMIAETAYFIAERRGFVSGSPTDDWLEAEVLVDRLLESGEGEDGTSSLSSK